MMNWETLQTHCHPFLVRYFFTAPQTWSFYRITAIFRSFLPRMDVKVYLLTSRTERVSSLMVSSKKWASKWIKINSFSSQCSLSSTRTSSNSSFITAKRCPNSNNSRSLASHSKTMLLLSRILLHQAKIRWLATSTGSWNNLSSTKCPWWINSNLKMWNPISITCHWTEQEMPMHSRLLINRLMLQSDYEVFY